MKLKGKVFKYGADVNTDVIIPARYLNVSDPDELAKHCMEDLDKDFLSSLEAGDIIWRPPTSAAAHPGSMPR